MTTKRVVIDIDEAHFAAAQLLISFVLKEDGVRLCSCKEAIGGEFDGVYARMELVADEGYDIIEIFQKAKQRTSEHLSQLYSQLPKEHEFLYNPALRGQDV